MPLLSTLKAKLEDLKRLDNEIVFLIQNEKDIEAEVEESCDFSSSVRETIAEIENALARSQDNKGDEEPSSPTIKKYFFTRDYRSLN